MENNQKEPSAIFLDSVRNAEPAFVVLRASAGSGKTFNLVRVFLALCLKSDDPAAFSKILAITFTNKAASEMKERILNGVREVSLGEGPHIEALSEELALQTEVLRHRAGQVYDTMMTRYGQLSVMTIDKFVNRLVRGFTRELAIDSDYRIWLDQAELIREGVDTLLARVGGDDAVLTTVIERYALQRVDDEKGWDMRGDLFAFGRLLFDEQQGPLLARLDGLDTHRLLDLHRQYTVEINEVHQRVRQWAEEALALVDAAGIEHNSFYGAGGFLPTYFKKLKSGEVLLPNASVQGMYEGSKPFYPKSLDAAVAERIDGIIDGLMGFLASILGELDGESGAMLNMKKALVGSMFQLATLKELRSAINEVRSARNVMTFSDMNRLIELLVNNNPAPFIFERIGERYRHFLIDEFQDTSVVQWQNLLPLVDESLAKAQYNLIVGDGKQAIYRWRNGDVRQLQKMPQIVGRELTREMAQRQATLERTLKEGFLADNWRSLDEVVTFNNRFFQKAQTYLDPTLASIYENSSQHQKGGAGGWVTAEAYLGKVKGETPLIRMERIHRLIEENRDAGYRYSDMAILVRENKVSGAIARALLELGVPTVTDESLQLGQHPAPWAVMSLLSYLNDPSDMKSAAWFMQCFHALRSPGQAQPEADYEQLIYYTDQAEGQRQKRVLQLEHFLVETCQLHDFDTLIGKPLFDVVTRIVNALGVAEKYPAHTEALLQLAYSYQSEADEGITGFLQYWENEGVNKSITVPNAIDGVRIITVHKSKGLEFPVVIHLIGPPSKNSNSRLHTVEIDDVTYGMPIAVVPLNKLENTTAHASWREERARQFLDDLNVVYVGMTRAARHLHVLLECAKSEAGVGVYDLAKVSAHIIDELAEASVHEGRIQFGEPIFPDQWEETPEHETLIVRSLRTEEVADRLKISVDRDHPDVTHGGLTPQAFGSELHALLARIRTTDDLNAIEKERCPWQRMNNDEWERLLNTARALVTHPKIAHWFDCDQISYTEREFMLENGDSVRPDRVVLRDEQYTVIDYKTGAPEKQHHKQVAHYVELLQLVQAKPVHGVLIYTDALEVIKVC